MKKIRNITILGDGGWGTTLAVLLAKKGLNTTLWGVFGDNISAMASDRVNKRFLPGIDIPAAVMLTADLGAALKYPDLTVIAIPSKFLRGVLKKIRLLGFSNGLFLSVTKGIEARTLMRTSEIIRDELGKRISLAVLSGPTIAIEVARGIPATAVISSSDAVLARNLQHVFTTDRFRVYTNPDVIGVELGGSLKNIIAIACGISDGLGFGANTKAAILSRGLAEISRLGIAMGARKETFSGLSGLGDLVTTCVSPHSRNRSVGEQIGKGIKLKDILSKMDMVAEGVTTAESGYLLSKKYNIPMPITEQVYLVLYKNKNPHRAVRDLMARDKKGE